jgi:hypothetical protein
VAQVVECLLSKLKVLSPNPSTTKREREREDKVEPKNEAKERGVGQYFL